MQVPNVIGRNETFYRAQTKEKCQEKRKSKLKIHVNFLIIYAFLQNVLLRAIIHQLRPTHSHTQSNFWQISLQGNHFLNAKFSVFRRFFFITHTFFLSRVFPIRIRQPYLFSLLFPIFLFLVDIFSRPRRKLPRNSSKTCFIRLLSALENCILSDWRCFVGRDWAFFRKWCCAHSPDKGGMKNHFHTFTPRIAFSPSHKLSNFLFLLANNPKLPHKNLHSFLNFEFSFTFSKIFIRFQASAGNFFPFSAGLMAIHHLWKIFLRATKLFFVSFFRRFSTLKPRIKLQNSTTCQWY